MHTLASTAIYTVYMYMIYINKQGLYHCAIAV